MQTLGAVYVTATWDMGVGVGAGGGSWGRVRRDGVGKRGKKLN